MTLSDAVNLLRVELSQLTIKSVNEIIREYQDTLERYIVSAANGNMSAGEMSRAHKSLLKRLAPQAYQEGMKEGGISDPESEMEDDDDQIVEDWIGEQSDYTAEFAKDAESVSDFKGDERTAKRDAMLDRVDDWIDSLRFIGQRGYLSAKGNIPLTFDGDDGKESCATCNKYKGMRKRKSWWEKRGLLDRPNDIFECGRFSSCQHGFYDDEGDLVVG